MTALAALMAAVIALGQIGAAAWMPREQQVLRRVVVLGLPIGGVLLWVGRGVAPRPIV